MEPGNENRPFDHNNEGSFGAEGNLGTDMNIKTEKNDDFEHSCGKSPSPRLEQWYKTGNDVGKKRKLVESNSRKVRAVSLAAPPVRVAVGVQK